MAGIALISDREEWLGGLRRKERKGKGSVSQAYPASVPEKKMGHPVFSRESTAAILGAVILHDFDLASPKGVFFRATILHDPEKLHLWGSLTHTDRKMCILVFLDSKCWVVFSR